MNDRYKLRCDALVDQNRYIGSDPVGHKCWLDAEYEIGTDGPLVCESCSKLLNAGRITFGLNYGSKFQMATVTKILDNLKSEKNDE